MSILVIGSVAFDNVTTPFGQMTDGLGGSATHFSMSASHFTDVHLVAVVGSDFPEKHIDLLKSKKIDVSGLERVEGKTFRWSGKYDYNLNNAQTLKTELNVFESFVPKVPDALKKTDILFLANIDPTLQSQVISQIPRPKLVACDTMNFWINGKRDELVKTLGKVDMLTINEGEARLLSDESNLARAAKKICAMGPKTLVIKEGEYGALLFHEDLVFSAPGLPLEDIQDPTGAGDSFAGGFLGFLSQTGDFSFENMKRAVITGSVMASFNVEAFSCERLKNLSMDEIRNRYRAFKRLSHFEELPG